MAYNIVEKNNAFLHLTTKVNKGTTFELYFPLVQNLKETLIKQIPTAAIKQSQGTILLIDDDTIIHIIARKMLEKAGYKVVITEEGLAGIDYYRKHQEEISLVLLDMAMPGLSGKEVYQQLRAINKNIKVLLSSGFSQDDRVKEALAMGVNAFLHKPYQIEELLAKVDEVLGKS